MTQRTDRPEVLAVLVNLDMADGDDGHLLTVGKGGPVDGGGGATGPRHGGQDHRVRGQLALRVEEVVGGHRGAGGWGP